MTIVLVVPVMQVGTVVAIVRRVVTGYDKELGRAVAQCLARDSTCLDVRAAADSGKRLSRDWSSAWARGAIERT
jgi:hypothetical protein